MLATPLVDLFLILPRRPPSPNSNLLGTIVRELVRVLKKWPRPPANKGTVMDKYITFPDMESMEAGYGQVVHITTSKRGSREGPPIPEAQAHNLSVSRILQQSPARRHISHGASGIPRASLIKSSRTR